MGGFAIKYPEKSIDLKGKEPQQSHENVRDWNYHRAQTRDEESIQQSRFDIQSRLEGNRKGEFDETPRNPNIDGQPCPVGEQEDIEPSTLPLEPSKYKNLHAVDVQRMLYLLELNFIELPRILPEEIDDRSKSDPFVRIIAVSQILWVLLQIIARAAKGLAVTQLEVTVLAFAGCAVGMYALNWYKPKGVSLPCIIHCKRPREEVEKEMKRKFFRDADEIRQGVVITILKDLIPTGKGDSRIHNTFSNEDTGWHTDWVVIIGSIAFGAVHLIAWDFHFPTRIEKILWWTSASLCSCCVPVLGLLTYILNGMLDFDQELVNRAEDNVLQERKGLAVLERWSLEASVIFMVIVSVVLAGIWILLAIAYIVARFYIFVEIFRTLCFLPPDAYVGTWAANLPGLV
ncbi:uncharacterized protein N7483_001874 [Penicillium malachiteum]|uniref:uncharacterized protein n=1 Tax=Penicillium malachiteum TaxID=1324776 RepID=UPI0025498815|nr:uncharacterized protein N7483_001874 [Penicillium malachiteum]KAJ5736749.1 hypothetical protein N7483_001874 [Penicillium malachiteum]